MRNSTEISLLTGKEVVILIKKCAELSENNKKLIDIGLELNIQPAVAAHLIQFSKLSQKTLSYLEKDKIKLTHLIDFAKPKIPSVSEINKSVTKHINKKKYNNHTYYWR